MGIFNSNVVVGVGAAVAATVLAPVILPVLATVGRPLAKSLIRGGLMLYDKSREAVAMAGEVTEDLVAEVRAEDTMQAAAGAGVAAGAGTGANAPQGPRREAPETAGKVPQHGADEHIIDGSSSVPAKPPIAMAGNGVAAS